LPSVRLNASIYRLGNPLTDEHTRHNCGLNWSTFRPGNKRIIRRIDANPADDCQVARFGEIPTSHYSSWFSKMNCVLPRLRKYGHEQAEVAAQHALP
jgi:hypothetical protein